MLNLDFLLRKRALWQKRTGTDVNRAVYAEGVFFPCWAEIEKSCAGMKGRVFLPAACPVSPGDKITVDGCVCFVKGVLAFPTHAECEIA